MTEEWNIRQEPAGKFLRLKDRSCNLNVHQIDRDTGSEDAPLSLDPTAEQSVLTTEKGKATKHLGRRGGSNERMEVQEVLNNGIENATHRYNSSVYEVGEAVPDRPILRSFTYTTPQEIGPIPFYLFSIVFVLTSTIFVSYVQEKFLKRLIPIRPKLGSLSGEEQESATNATPQCLLEIFKSYQNKTISKAKAVYILVHFYDLSEIEAVKLLDE